MKTPLLKDFEVWLNKRYRINTVRGIISDTENFIAWCKTENIQAEKTTYNELLSFVAYCKSNCNAKSTINQKITTLKQFYNYLIELKQREENPASELRIRNQQYKIPFDTIKYEELEQLYKAYPSKGIVGKRNKSIVGLVIYQGVNASELQALEVKDLKLEEGKIYIPSTGRSNDRTLKLEAHQIVQLQNYLLQIRPVLVAMNDHTTDKLFFTTGGSTRLNNSFQRMMLLLKGINPNVKDLKQLRASVIAHWYKLHNTRQVQYMAGHRYVSSTERYRTDKLESLQQQLEKMHPIQ
jgi:site-specific recombinase XerD